MRRLLIISAFIALAASATPAFSQITVKVQPVTIESRGGHWAEPSRNFQWILGYYMWGTAKQATTDGKRAIGIFSVSEFSDPLVAGSTYEATFKPAGATRDHRGVTVAAAFLIEGYATGRLAQWNSSFSYDEHSHVRLQAAIHAVEQTNPSAVPDDLHRLVLAHYGSWQRALQPYEGSAVRILALTPPGSGNSSIDHLVYLPDAPVELAHPLGLVRAGTGGGSPVTPGGFIPPVVPPPGPTTDDEFQELTKDLIITIPTTKPEDDFFSSNPSGPTITPNSDPSSNPGNPPGTNGGYTPDPNGGYTPDPPKSVPEEGMTAAMILSSIVLMAWTRRRKVNL